MFAFLWVWVWSGKKGACWKERGLLAVSFTRVEVIRTAVLFFLFFCLDSPEGFQEGAGMGARAVFNWTTVLRGRNPLFPAQSFRTVFRVCSHSEARLEIPVCCLLVECFMREVGTVFENSCGFFLLRCITVGSTRWPFLPLKTVLTQWAHPSLVALVIKLVGLTSFLGDY